MAKISNWVRKVAKDLIDPDRDARVTQLVQILQHGLQTQRDKFSLSVALLGVEHTQKDVDVAAEQVYREVLARGWSDEQLTPAEQHTAKWVARCLEIPESKVSQINYGFARQYFGLALAEAMEDGVLDQNEEVRLQRIAASVGLSTNQFTREFFRQEGEAFLRSIFLACISDGVITTEEWNYLIAVAEKLGIKHEELLLVIAPQSRQFVEHVLADVKSDGMLSQHEDETLQWLMNNLSFSIDFRKYVEHELATLRTLTQIENGRLPSIQPPAGLAIRAGEIVHHHSPATWRHARVLKSGPRIDDHRGIATVTDTRLIFSSPTKSQNFTYRQIISHRGYYNWIEIQLQNKPVNTFFFSGESPLPYAIIRNAIALANQTKVVEVSGTPSRHIPRDVRQRVWQRYGGRCAECGANDYLEFDHVIPVAKGGSNMDANIQLLCRRCNLKKSDRI